MMVQDLQIMNDSTKDSSPHERIETNKLPLMKLEPVPVGQIEDENHFLTTPTQNSSFLVPPSARYGTNYGAGGEKGTSSVYYLTKLQKYSSYAFTAFASLHIANTSLIPLLTQSVSASETYLLLTRPYYQSFPLEPLLVGLPIALHVSAGFALRLRRRNINLVRYGAVYLPISKRFERRLKVWPPMSWPCLTGYLLVPLIGGHVLVNRILPWIYEGDSSNVGLGYVAHSFAKHRILATLSYVSLIGIAVSHFCWGVCRWNGLIIVGDGEKARRRRRLINSVSGALATVWMAGGLGIIARGGRADGWIGQGYDMLLRHIWL
ncbi:hypothetical protein GcC1_166001 [Golovinomyces cichoracearum]|uniref:Mitochondrial adapter protein MCP1 transmembrane domain-containing protein n=1 Tax=Golovinomyces cichoracearum TaxID=62708 RepID=A0A420HSE4_9PEZI|nr:hypothetical protein GcC1_166001 [Golovinomyces cichoracearum]